MSDLGEKIAGKKITISGSGNVAQFAAEKCLELGGVVLTLSDSAGTIYEVIYLLFRVRFPPHSIFAAEWVRLSQAKAAGGDQRETREMQGIPAKLLHRSVSLQSFLFNGFSHAIF